MPRTSFPPPWHPSPETWSETGLSEKLGFPGLATDCAPPQQGAVPVTYRFLDIFLRRDLDMPFADMPEVDPEALSMQLPDNDPRRRQSAFCDPREEHCLRSWQVTRPVWALAVTYEQAWYWLGCALGELADSISLTPGEELEVQVFTWDRSKLSEDLQSTDLVDRRTESSLTVHSSSQVVNRMEEQTQWQLGANVGFSYGVTAGIEASYGETTTESLERRREARQEQTRKTAQQIRSERQIKISTSRETGLEERRKRVLRNENPTRTVTYNFYETVSHYKVDLALVETETAIALPNRLPRITPDWVVCHEGLLRKVLLDATQEEGFDAARDLKRGSDLERDIIADAARRLKEAFEDRRTTEVELAPEEVIPEGPFGGTAVRAILAGLTFGASEAVFGTADLVTYLSEDGPAENREDRPTGRHIEEFLAGVVDSPSLSGLLIGLKLVSDHHVPWYVGRFGRFDRYQCYPITEEIDRAIGYGKAAALAMAAAAPPELTASDGDDGDAEAEAAKANQAAWLEWKSRQAEKYRALRESRALFEALRCHIEHNLLHYMRPIWLAEDPAVRLKRHARELGLGELELKQFVRQPLLGFHLNCCVYPCEPPAYENMVPMMLRQSKELHHFVDKELRGRARRRFDRDAQRVLIDALERAVHQSVACAEKERALTVTELPTVLKEAGKHVESLRKEMDDGEGWTTYLTPAEEAGMAPAKARAAELEATARDAQQAIDEGRVRDFEHTVVSAGELARDLAVKQDFLPIMIALPEGGYHCEPVVGRCPAAEDLRARGLEAETRLAEAEADRLRKRVDDLPADKLAAGPEFPTINVRVVEESD
jgi:hypothetical protein